MHISGKDTINKNHKVRKYKLLLDESPFSIRFACMKTLITCTNIHQVARLSEKVISFGQSAAPGGHTCN